MSHNDAAGGADSAQHAQQECQAISHVANSKPGSQAHLVACIRLAQIQVTSLGQAGLHSCKNMFTQKGLRECKSMCTQKGLHQCQSMITQHKIGLFTLRPLCWDGYSFCDVLPTVHGTVSAKQVAVWVAYSACFYHH